MRRLLYVTAFALFLAVPLWAQRGGHGGGFGGHASFGGGHTGGFSGRGFGSVHTGGGHFSGGMRTGFSRGPVRSYNRGFSRGPYLDSGSHGGFHNNRFHGRFHDHGFRHSRFNYGYWAYPLWGAYYDPWMWDWAYDDSRFDANYQNDLAQANEMNEQSLEQQRMLREEEAAGDQDLYNPNASRASSNPAPSENGQGTVVTPPTVLVFRDHHQQEIQNYAIVGQTLWIFASPNTQKVSLAELDLPATQKANEDRGVTFQPPNVNEGQ